MDKNNENEGILYEVGAYNAAFMHVIFTCMRVPFSKKFPIHYIVHFCPFYVFFLPSSILFFSKKLKLFLSSPRI